MLSKRVGVQEPASLLPPLLMKHESLSGKAVAGTTNRSTACRAPHGVLDAASLNSETTVTHLKVSLRYGDQIQFPHARILHHLPVGMPHGVGEEAVAPDPLPFLDLAVGVDDQALGLDYPVYAGAAYILSFLPEPLGSPRHALGPTDKVRGVCRHGLALLCPEPLDVPLRPVNPPTTILVFCPSPDALSYAVWPCRPAWASSPPLIYAV